MPGELRASALCPVCGDRLICIVDTSTSEYVRREYYHGKASPKARRRRRCLQTFTDHAEAAAERRRLEVVAHIGRKPIPMPNCKPAAPRRRAHAQIFTVMYTKRLGPK